MKTLSVAAKNPQPILDSGVGFIDDSSGGGVDQSGQRYLRPRWIAQNEINLIIQFGI
jgi:hypothetical protein